MVEECSLIRKDLQYAKFCAYGFLKNLQFAEPFMLLFLLDRGVSYTQIGVLISIRAISTNILEIPSGIFADGFGRRRAMMLCFLAYIWSFGIFAFTDSFYLLMMAMVFFAFGEAFRTGTHKAMIIEYLRITGQLEHKTEYYGYTRSWSQLGSAVSAAVAALFVFVFSSYSLLFGLSIGTYTLGFLLMVSYPRELDFSPGETATPSGRWQRYLDSLRGLIDVARNATSRNALLNIGAFGGIFKTAKDYIQPLMAQSVIAGVVIAGLTAAENTALDIGIIYIIIYTLNAFSARNAARLVGKFGSPARGVDRLFKLSAVVLLGMGIMLFLNQPLFAALLLIVIYIIRNVRRPMEVAYLSGMVRERSMAAGLSGESQVQSLVTAIIAPLFGLLIDCAGLAAAFSVLGGTAALFSILFSIRER